MVNTTNRCCTLVRASFYIDAYHLGVSPFEIWLFISFISRWRYVTEKVVDMKNHRNRSFYQLDDFFSNCRKKIGRFFHLVFGTIIFNKVFNGFISSFVHGLGNFLNSSFVHLIFYQVGSFKEFCQTID